jgi:glycine/D-amino acid oxidase-like deaminating enzyme
MSFSHTRDLRSGASIWSAHRHIRPPATRLRRSTRADVVVVGAGITGSLVANALAECGLKPLVLERRRGAIRGSTAASTALLQFELDTPLTHLSRRLGERAAVQAWRCSHAAVNELRTQAHRLGIRAHLHSRPSLYLAGDVLDAAGLRREVRLRQRHGLPSEYLSRRALRHHFEIDRAAALLSHGNAEADPVALASAFLHRAVRMGARLHAPHEVVDLKTHRQGVTLATRDGLEIHTRRVVLCMGYELPKIVPTRSHRISSTWAMATAPQPERLWPQRALIWEASDPYLYLRSTVDGAVICGGEDEDFADEERRNAAIPAKTQRLQSKLARLMPQLDARARYAWAGSFGSSTSGMPSIGEIPGYRHCHAVLGYGGNGITFSMLAARFLSQAVRGKPDPDAKLFAFQ